jgi:hypothetical protein
MRQGAHGPLLSLRERVTSFADALFLLSPTKWERRGPFAALAANGK